VNGTVAVGQRLTISEISARLRVPVPTVDRLFRDGCIRVIRERGWRMAYESQIAYVAEALAACRPGSIEQFCREWLAAHPLPAVFPEAVA
jgi:DNA-binding GntR family transcriptional regulator